MKDLVESCLQSDKELTIEWILILERIERNKLADQEAKKHVKVPLREMYNQASFYINANRKRKNAKANNWPFEKQKQNFSEVAQTYMEWSLKLTSDAKFLIETGKKSARIAHCSQIRLQTLQCIPQKVWERKDRYALRMPAETSITSLF